MRVPTTALSKLVSRMLRHKPARHGLECDAEGWVGVDALLSAVRRHGPGLRPMRRQYVHLSVDHATALAVGRRKSRDAVVLRIDAGRAFAAGVAVYPGNETVWLAERVPPQYVARAEAGER